MKFVYVLTSSEKDIYLDQLYLSVSSLRAHSRDARVIVLVDSETMLGLNGYRADVTKIAEFQCVDVPDFYGKTERSRYIKTTIRKHVDGDFLFIDTDTVVCRELVAPDCELGMVYDANTRIVSPQLHEGRKRDARICGFREPSLDNFNSGVIYARDTAVVHEFFNAWHENWKLSLARGVKRDQPALAEAQLDFPGLIKVLGNTWNLQVYKQNKVLLKDVMAAKVMHFIVGFDAKKSGQHARSELFDYGLWARIKQNEGLTDEARRFIAAPGAGLRDAYLIALGSEQDALMSTDTYHFIKTLHAKKKWIFSAVESFFSGIRVFYCWIKKFRKKDAGFA